MSCKAYDLAVLIFISDDTANSLSFLDDVESINCSMKFDIICRLNEAIIAYKTDRATWNRFKDSDGQSNYIKLKRMSHTQIKSKLKKTYALLLECSLNPCKNDELLCEHLRFKAIRLEYESVKLKDTMSKVKNKLPAEPNKNFIEYIIKTIHKDFKIPKQSETVRDLLPTI